LTFSPLAVVYSDTHRYLVLVPDEWLAILRLVSGANPHPHDGITPSV
jgi:hypothetical protein